MYRKRKRSVSKKVTSEEITNGFGCEVQNHNKQCN